MFNLFKKRQQVIEELSKMIAPEPEPAPVDTSEGILFGLSPPPGHYFRVNKDDHSRTWWFVYICKNGQMNSAGYVAMSGSYSSDPEVAIKDAANRVLKKFAEKEKASLDRSKYEGNYPPKFIKET